MKTFSNTKGTRADSLCVRQELADQNRQRQYWPQGNGHFIRAPWVWKKHELKAVMEVISTIKTPTNFVSNLSKRVKDNKLSGMKSHDYHILLQYILPIAIRGTLTPGLRDSVYRLASFFRWLCSKSIAVVDINPMKAESVEIMCGFEMEMPPTFFDIMPHLVVHLAEEVELAGPVHARWLYFLERYMLDLKKLVRQNTHPEGSMAEGYLAKEALFYCTDLISQMNPGLPRLWSEGGRPKDEGLLLPKTSQQRQMTGETLVQVRASPSTIDMYDTKIRQCVRDGWGNTFYIQCLF